MGRVVFFLLLLVTSIWALRRPWIGVAASYLVAILTPQAVWYWNFEGLRPALWLLLPTLIGFGVGIARGELRLDPLRNRRIALLAALWVFFAISYFFGPYVDVGGPYRFSDAGWAFETLNKVLLLCFVAVVCIDDERKVAALAGVLVASAIYLVYWANAQYLTGQVWGRLAGPVDETGTGIYADENTFAMLFVVAQPFLWYGGFALRSAKMRYALWLVIPFAWHAVFLTASRGGLVGVAAVTTLIALRSNRKALSLLLIPALAVAYVWQAGDLMKSRAETIDEFRTESSAATRLEAWGAAWNMMRAHPVTGVGLASFGPAFPTYSPKEPREAHNTLLQVAGESGMFAGLALLLLVFGTLRALWRNTTRLQENPGPEGHGHILSLLNEATLVALCGFSVCALFLSLQMYEILYFLLVLANGILFASSRRATSQ
jgi:probable O-glycosylation ligase (exosortase A-associated)